MLEVAADRVELLFLDDDRDRRGVLELEVEQGLAAGKHGADLAFARLERASLAAAAVDDPGHRVPRAADGASCASRTPHGEPLSGFRVREPSQLFVLRSRRGEPIITLARSALIGRRG